jgi:small subunit ribosomal protein S14|tara:strand:- start:5742 stop:6047 length:306 start_codon:yes stop_codon:yes gene_type:complete
MARKCVPLRDEKRRAMVERAAEKRAELKAIISSETASFEDKMAARDELNAMPRDTSKVRVVNRCSITGRPHGVFRAVGICRNKFREMAANGELPGFTKSSW